MTQDFLDNSPRKNQMRENRSSGCWRVCIIKSFLNTTNLGTTLVNPIEKNIDLQLTCCSESKTLTDPHPQMGFTGLSQILALETPVLPLNPLRQPLRWPREGFVTLEWVT